jgi:hypothetical protein
MVMVIRKIFNENFDSDVHSSFMKYSRGEFKNKYLIHVKKQAKKTALKTSVEFTNDVVRASLLAVNGPVAVTGVIISTNDLIEELGLPIKKKSNFQGVRKLELDTEVESSKIIELMGKYPKVFFALSFKTDDIELKVKKKGPGKPGNKKEGPKADFCVLKTTNQDIIKEFLFDVKDYKEVFVNHTIMIEEMVYPSNIDDLSPKEIREQAKRKGRVIRTATIDDKEVVSEAKFVA